MAPAEFRWREVSSQVAAVLDVPAGELLQGTDGGSIANARGTIAKRHAHRMATGQQQGQGISHLNRLRRFRDHRRKHH